jgi:hypothetical protein
MHSGADLIEIIRKSHSPLPVVTLEDIIAVSELSWISFGLLWFKSAGSSNVGIEIKVVAVNGLRWLESLIVISGVSCLSTGSFTGCFMMVICGFGGKVSHLGSSNKGSLSQHGSFQLSLHHFLF